MDPANIFLFILGVFVFSVVAFGFYLWASTRGICQYCNQTTGFWKQSHKECSKHAKEQASVASQKKDQARKEALTTWNNACREYYLDKLPESELETVMESVSDILSIPYMQRIADKIQAETKREIRHGREIEYSRNLDAFVKGEIGAEDMESIIHQTENDLSFTKMGELESLAAATLAEEVLADGVLTDDEFRRVEQFLSLVSSGDKLKSKPKIRQVFQLRIIELIRQDRWPEIIAESQSLLAEPHGVVFLKDEFPVWKYSNVSLLKERHKRTYVGGSAGVSVRVCRGVYVRSNSFKGNPVDESWMETKDTGSLLVTNRSIYFISGLESIRIPWKKVVSVSCYSNNTAMIHKNTKEPVILKGFDPWFLANFASAIQV